MGTVFILTLGLSLAGGATCLAVFASGALVRKKLRSSWLYYLWLIALLCFIIPVPLNLPFSSDGFRSVTAAISSAMTAPAQPPVSLTGESTEYASADSAPTGSSTLTETPSSSENGAADTPGSAAQAARNGNDTNTAASTLSASMASILRLLPMIWLTGAAAALLWTLTGYARTLHRLRRGRTLKTPGRVPVYEHSRVTSPLLAGVFRPAVYLPAGFLNPELAIRHELTHLRRGDLWLKWLVQLTACAHWFNPLVWLMKRELNRLCELACDKAAVRRLGETERRTYGAMLLDTAGAMADRGGMLIASLGRDKQILQERLREIMKAKKASRKAVAVMSALFAVILTAAVVFGAMFTGCAKQSGSADESAAASAVTDTAPSPSPSPSPAPASASPVIVSPDGSASPDAVLGYSVGCVIVINLFDEPPFDDNPAAHGRWSLADIVENADDFEPGKQQYTGAFRDWTLVIGQNETLGRTAYYLQSAVNQPSQDKEDHPPLDKAASYEIKKLDGATYMFIEVKDDDGNTSFMVWKQYSDVSFIYSTYNYTPGEPYNTTVTISDGNIVAHNYTFTPPSPSPKAG
jgi:beta-lactamase regulating signal transducer with metallopeptidase domain